MGLNVSKQAGQSVAAVAVIAVLLLTAFALLPGASADRTAVLDVTLPSPREGVSAVAVPEGILLFGGSDGGRLSDILLYDPLTERLIERDAELPTGRSSAAAIYDGEHVYLFGGWTANGYSDEILRYDPDADHLETLETTLPSPRSHMAADFHGSHVYLFGGRTDCHPCDSDEILRYDPAQDTLEVLDVTLPTPRSALTAAATGDEIIVFGGVNQQPHERYDDILHFHPQSETLAPADDRLPQPRSHASSFAIDGRVYLFGGRACDADACEDIYAYQPADGTLTTKQLRLAGPRSLTGAAVYDGHGYIFGGTGDARLDEILRLSPSGAGEPVAGAPHIEAIDDIISRARDPLTIHVKAQDPRGEEVHLHAGQMPPGAEFTDHEDGIGELNWTPTDDQAGEHDLVIRASTDSRTSSEHFTITVNPYDAPRINHIWDRSLQENERLNVIIEAADHDKRPITLDAAPLPEGADFTDHGNGQGQLEWQTQFGQQGIYTFTVTATAGGVTATERFTATVERVPQPPEILPQGPITAVVGQVQQLLVEATHPHDEPVHLSANQLPTGAGFADQGDGTGILTWAPEDRQVGSHEAKIRAETDDRSTTKTFTLNAIREHDFEVEPHDKTEVVMSPTQTREFRSDVTNTGNSTLVFSFTGLFLHTDDDNWEMQPPETMTLEPGETQVVALGVTASAETAGAMARLEVVAHDHDDPGSVPPLEKINSWLIDVPVVIDLELDDHNPSIAKAATQGIHGTVTLFWADGSPAVGIPVELEHRQELADGVVTTTYDNGQTSTSGSYAFVWETEPTTITPGDHRIIATAQRGTHEDDADAAYTVGP